MIKMNVTKKGCGKADKNKPSIYKAKPNVHVEGNKLVKSKGRRNF